MTQLNSAERSIKKMVIIAGYIDDETYGLLGPQMAATIIQDHTPYACIVIAVPRKYDRAVLKKALTDYFSTARPLIGFSALSGREDLFNLARELRDEGVVTILAGPQSDVDFLESRAGISTPIGSGVLLKTSFLLCMVRRNRQWGC